MLAAEHRNLDIFFQSFAVVSQFFVSSVITSKVPSQLIDQNDGPKLLISLESSLFYLANDCRVLEFTFRNKTSYCIKKDISVCSA